MLPGDTLGCTGHPTAALIETLLPHWLQATASHCALGGENRPQPEQPLHTASHFPLVWSVFFHIKKSVIYLCMYLSPVWSRKGSHSAVQSTQLWKKETQSGSSQKTGAELQRHSKEKLAMTGLWPSLRDRNGNSDNLRRPCPRERQDVLKMSLTFEFDINLSIKQVGSIVLRRDAQNIDRDLLNIYIMFSV